MSASYRKTNSNNCKQGKTVSRALETGQQQRPRRCGDYRTGAGESADWPLTVGPLRNKLPDANWASLSLSLPDMQSLASQPRMAQAPTSPAPVEPNTSSKEASTTAKPIEQAASAGTENAVESPPGETFEAMSKADAERIFARIDAAVAFAQQQNMRSLVLLGHGTGAYWAARYVSEKQPAQLPKLIMVAARTRPGLNLT